MIYLGILTNLTAYIKLQKTDIKYFTPIIGIMCIIAIIINKIFDSNLIFVSQLPKGTPIEILYNLTNGLILFNIIMVVG